MKHEFRLADIGEGLEEAEIIRWLVQVGDEVARDQPLIEVMTDKSHAELPAPTAGVVLELGGDVGDILTVGELIAVIDAATIAGTEDAPTPIGDHAIEAAQPAASETRDAAGTAVAGRPKASPSTRRAAAERGIDLTTIAGSGPGGRILLGDLDTTAPSTVSAPPAPPPTAGVTAPADEPASQPPPVEPAIEPEPVPVEPRPDPPTAPITTSAVSPVSAEPPAAAPPAARRDPEAPAVQHGAEAGSTVPLRGMRRAVAQNMARSWFDIPHIHAFEHIDAQPLIELQQQLRGLANSKYERLTPLTFFVAAVAAALRDHPQANASVNMADDTITYHAAINVGVAVAAPQGLVVPVLRSADTLDFPTLSVALGELIRGARDGSLGREHFSDGTATITNFGSLGGEQATPLIRPPEAVIIGFGSIADRPFVIEGQVVARKTMHLVLGADHRLLDGDVTTSILSHITKSLTSPLRLVLD